MNSLYEVCSCLYIEENVRWVGLGFVNALKIYLKVEQALEGTRIFKNMPWVGSLGHHPAEYCYWIAIALRYARPYLRIYWVLFLVYNYYILEDIPSQPEFDLVDPCGLNNR